MEAKNNVAFSVVVPVFNGALALPELCESIISNLHNYAFEIILVDDASKDKSWNSILTLKTKYPFVHGIRHGINKGQTAGLISGFKICKGKYIITIDDDLQFNPADILTLMRSLEKTGADIIYGKPVRSLHPAWRNVLGAGAKGIGYIMGYRFKGSSFRLLKREVVESLITDEPKQRMLLDILFFRSTYKIETVKVPHYKRKYGRSNYNFSRLVFLFFTSVLAYCKLSVFNRQQK